MGERVQKGWGNEAGSRRNGTVLPMLALPNIMIKAGYVVFLTFTMELDHYVVIRQCSSRLVKFGTYHVDYDQVSVVFFFLFLLFLRHVNRAVMNKRNILQPRTCVSTYTRYHDCNTSFIGFQGQVEFHLVSNEYYLYESNLRTIFLSTSPSFVTASCSLFLQYSVHGGK